MIEEKRNQLYQLAIQLQFTHPKVIEASQELDQYISVYQEQCKESGQNKYSN
ncbi:Spo0E family sporulation regulatory protein-aspartic acid phosphatase [Cytobacillus pseudoceanisediminis]|uniref:Spo0E family sporulation regulatory protein-aspartic acid phosphatase n=1 Tax=Cytobacillus pseudoceanisediminis TaxID=3051614 RepID=UPI00365CBC80